MIIGYFDLAVLGILIVINILILRNKTIGKVGCLVSFFLFGIILPMLSIKLEIDRVANERDILDQFTMLYTYFKFPIYWVVGALQMAILNSKIEDN